MKQLYHTYFTVIKNNIKSPTSLQHTSTTTIQPATQAAKCRDISVYF